MAAETLEQQRIRTVSQVDAGQFVRTLPGQTEGNQTVPGIKVDLLNNQGNFARSIDVSETEGTYSANEFDPTVNNGIAAADRIPAVITTEQRMMGGQAIQNLPASAETSKASDSNQKKAQAKATATLNRLGWKVIDGKPMLQDDFGRIRNPFQCIILHINPSEVQFAQSLRGANSKNKSGTVLYTWRDSKRKSFFDEPVVTMTFHTGNISPFSYIADVAKRKEIESSDYQTQPISRGLANFYRFLELVDDRKILPDGRPNFVYITHSSRKFPKLTLVGFFDPDAITIVDNADDPNQLTWTASFTCRHTFPHLSDSTQLLQVYQNAKLKNPG